MSEDRPQPPEGVREKQAAWEAPAAARPLAGDTQWDAMIDDIRRRFPKTLARLAE